VERGAFASVGVDYQRAGKNSADIAFKILKKGVRPHSIVIVEEHNPPSLINRDLARILSIGVADG
jgi:ABC-type uncharacterized transport system substrate-binding protein